MVQKGFDVETELTLSIGGFPPLSARGCTQTLSLPEAKFARTLCGRLICTGPRTQKYKTIIEGSDKRVLTTDSFITPGIEIEVGCIQRVWQRVLKGPFKLSRDFVPHSLYFESEGCKGPLSTCYAPQEGFVSYRPHLKMALSSCRLFTDEWNLTTKWSIELEEI